MNTDQAIKILENLKKKAERYQEMSKRLEDLLIGLLIILTLVIMLLALALCFVARANLPESDSQSPQAITTQETK